ncbi:hypothetical protein HWV62_18726 [Athelia sp. TMB]|nr:hypothetical protein HWV62_18726 [Athelia sp. TMB]
MSRQNWHQSDPPPEGDAPLMPFELLTGDNIIPFGVALWGQDVYTLPLSEYTRGQFDEQTQSTQDELRSLLHHFTRNHNILFQTATRAIIESRRRTRPDLFPPHQNNPQVWRAPPAASAHMGPPPHGMMQAFPHQQTDRHESRDSLPVTHRNSYSSHPSASSSYTNPSAPPSYANPSASSSYANPSASSSYANPSASSSYANPSASSSHAYPSASSSHTYTSASSSHTWHPSIASSSSQAPSAPAPQNWRWFVQTAESLAPAPSQATPAPAPSQAAPAPAPSQAAPASAPSQAAPAPAPSQAAPAPAPSQAAPAPAPSQAAPAPAPSQAAPASAPSQAASAPGPSQVAPAPGPSQAPPSPGPSQAPPSPGPSYASSTWAAHSPMDYAVSLPMPHSLWGTSGDAQFATTRNNMLEMMSDEAPLDPIEDWDPFDGTQSMSYPELAGWYPGYDPDASGYDSNADENAGDSMEDSNV